MTKNEFLRRLPKVDDIMRILGPIEIERSILREIVSEEIAGAREKLLCGDNADAGMIREAICERVRQSAEQLLKPSIRRVINGTGVVLHTNLGRSVFHARGLEELMGGYCNLELSIESGERGDRNQHISELLGRITGCEAALAVNNNAAAVMLVLTALAHGRSVVVSRGEQVEIGGSFRIPDVALLSGAKMVEVGTTNVTRPSDYEAALQREPDAALLMRVEPSNFTVIGQSSRPKNSELFRIAHEHSIPYYIDLGSGVLEPALIEGAIEREYIAGKNIKSLISHADLLSFSGDKLLGSAQAGLIVGKKIYIDRLKRHPLYRAMRLDKATIAILCSTLIDAISGRPTLLSELLSATADTLRERAERFSSRFADGGALRVSACPMTSSVGGGTFANTSLPSYGIEIHVDGMTASQISEFLRRQEVPVMTTILRDIVRIDFRTLFPQDIDLLFEQIRALTC